MEHLGRLHVRGYDIGVYVLYSGNDDPFYNRNLSTSTESANVTVIYTGPRASAQEERLKRFFQEHLTKEGNIAFVRLERGLRYTDRQGDAPARSKLSRILGASDLIILISEASDPWNALVSGADALFSSVPSARLLHIDLDRNAAALEEAIAAAPRWRASSTVCANSYACQDQSAGDMLLRTVPEGVLASLLHPGCVGIDLADWFAAFGEGPLLVHSGFGSGRGPERASSALEAAVADLRLKGGYAKDLSAVLATAGMPVDGTLDEMEWVVSQFEAQLPSESDPVRIVAAPMGPFVPFETFVLTGRRVSVPPAVTAS